MAIRKPSRHGDVSSEVRVGCARLPHRPLPCRWIVATRASEKGAYLILHPLAADGLHICDQDIEAVRLAFESFEDRRAPEAAISGLTASAHDDDLDGVFTGE